MRSGSQSGFSLIGMLVSIAVLTTASLGVMKLLSRGFKANSAVKNDIELETVKRSLMQRIDCAKTAETSTPGYRKAQIVALVTGNGRTVIPPRAQGTPIGRFHFRAVLLPDGMLRVQARMVNAAGQVVKHPLLADVTHTTSDGRKQSANYDWKYLFPDGAPLCDFNALKKTTQSADSSVDPREDESVELVYFQTGRFKAKGGDIMVTASFVSDGAYSCRNSLLFVCSGVALRAEGETREFLLKENQTCRVRVESKRDGAPSSTKDDNCRGGSISSPNGLTAKQGHNLWRIQWEDRLATRTDTVECANRPPTMAKNNHPACRRLQAVDWNDAIWHVRGRRAVSR